MTAVSDRVAQTLGPVIDSRGFDLERVEVQPAGRRRVLRVIVDGDDGVDLDAIAALTRDLSATLDANNTMGDQPYLLEVTSPGVDRPLSHPRHWRRSQGHLVAVTSLDGRTVTGRVVKSDDEGAHLDTADGLVRVRYDDVARAQVQVEFNPPSRTESE